MVSVSIQSIQGPPHRVPRTQPMIATNNLECILLHLMTGGEIPIY